MADFRDKLKSALLYTSDYAAGQTGEKQNLYGTYQEQKTKREQMEREAALAQQKLQMDLYKQQLLSEGRRQEAQVREIGGLPERGLRPVTAADVQRAPIGPGITRQQATQRHLVRKANQALYQGSQRAIVPSSDGTFQRFMPDSTLSSKSALEQQRIDISKQETARRDRKQFRDTFLSQGGRVYESQAEDLKTKSGMDFIESAKALKLKPQVDPNNGEIYYEYPAGQSKPGIEKLITKNKERSQNLETQIKRANILYTQYNKALEGVDQKQSDAWKQRGIGWFERAKTKFGFDANPKLVALINNQREMAIALLRAAGEVGALNEAEAKEAIKAVQLESKTPEERANIVKQKLELAIAGAPSDAIDMLKERSAELQPLLNEFGIDIQNLGETMTSSNQLGSGLGATPFKDQSKEARYQAWKKSQGL